MQRIVSTLIVSLVLTAHVHAAPLLWNTLGSAAEVQNSSYGPDLTFYTGGDPFGAIATPAYVPGVFGNGLSIGPGGYVVGHRVHNVVWNDVDQHLNSERGTIEAWFKQDASPVAFSYGVYRIFDGSYGLGSGVNFTSEADTGNTLNFGVSFGGTYRGVSINIAPHNGTWIHVAGVWDRDGIDGSGDSIRLYLNGAVASATTLADWGTTVGQQADIGGGNDNNIAGKFAMDNLKVYDVAMTDFSNRFDEASIPEPASLSLLAFGVLALHRRRRVA